MFTPLAKFGLTVAIFLVSTSGLMLLTGLPASSPQFIVTVLTCGIGLFLGLFCSLVLCLERKRT